jgi:dienelactone hydrolase
VIRALTLGLAALAIIFAARAAGAADERPLTFDANSVGGPNSGATLEVWRPAGSGPFPAVVVLHSCIGVSDHTRSWAARLNGWGYVAVIVDSFRPRRQNPVCTFGGVTYRIRGQDAFNAATYLRTLPYIMPDRIGVIGFSHGAAAALWASIASEVPADRGGRAFQAAVAYYTECNPNPPRVDPATDLLILIGKNDDWTPAEKCVKHVAAKAGLPHAPAIKVYPGAVHSFDIGGVPHLYDGHMVGGNSEAADDSFAMTKAFFDARLKTKQ